MDLDDGSPYILLRKPLLFGVHIFPLLNPFADNSLHKSRFLCVPGSMAFQEAFSCMSKVAGSLLFWFTSASGSNLSQQISDNQHGPRPGCSQCPKQVKDITCTRHNHTGFRFSWRSKREFSSPVVFGKISSFMMRLLGREAERLQSFPVLSLAVAALVPPFDNVSSKVLAVLLENSDVQLHGFLEQAPCEVGHHGCSGLAFHDLNWTRHAVEPRTGIEFPMMLVNILSGEKKSNITSEVLVGTGSRTMKIIKIKSLKVYAFGFYVRPNSAARNWAQSMLPSQQMN